MARDFIYVGILTFALHSVKSDIADHRICIAVSTTIYCDYRWSRALSFKNELLRPIVAETSDTSCQNSTKVIFERWFTILCWFTVKHFGRRDASILLSPELGRDSIS